MYFYTDYQSSRKKNLDQDSPIDYDSKPYITKRPNNQNNNNNQSIGKIIVDEKNRLINFQTNSQDSLTFDDFINGLQFYDVIEKKKHRFITKAKDLLTNQHYIVEFYKEGNRELFEHKLKIHSHLNQLPNNVAFKNILSFEEEQEEKLQQKKISIIIQETSQLHIFDLPNFSEPLILDFLLQVTSNLQILEKKSIVHRNLTPKSIGWQAPFKFCLDIDDNAMALEKYSHFVTDLFPGTLAYMSPEIYNNFVLCERLQRENQLNYDPIKADIFSLGIIAFECIGLRREERFLLKTIEFQQFFLEKFKHEYPLAVQVLARMIEVNVKKRITLLELKQEILRLQKKKGTEELYENFVKEVKNYKKVDHMTHQKDETKEQIEEANKKLTISKAYKFLNRFNSGLSLLNEALQIFEKIYKTNDEWDLIDNILKTKAQICNQQLYSGNLLEARNLAEEILQEKIQLSIDQESNYSIAKCYFNLGCITYYEKESHLNSKSMEYMKKCVELLHQSDISKNPIYNKPFKNFYSQTIGSNWSTFQTQISQSLHLRQKSLQQKFQDTANSNIQSYETPCCKPIETVQALPTHTLLLIQASYSLAQFYEEQNEAIDATVYFQQARDLIKNAIRQHQISFTLLAKILNAIGFVFQERAEYKIAISCYLDILQVAQKKLGKRHIIVANQLWNLGNVYIKLGKQANKKK